MGIGPGSLVSDMEMYQTLDKNRLEMFLESIDQILNIWKLKAPYDIKGKYWNISTTKTYNKNLLLENRETISKTTSRNSSDIIGC